MSERTREEDAVPPARVIVAGGGPTGLMLAGELALAGVEVVVLDPLPERDPAAPGVAINAACAELLDQRGLLDPVREECFVLPGVHFSLIFLDMSQQREPHEDAYVVPQHVVSRLLEERAAGLGAEIRRGHELVGFEQDGAGVSAVVHGPSGAYSLRGAYLAGCDGRRSTVRTLLGTEFAGFEDPGCRGLIGEVDVDLSALPMEHFGAYVSPDGGIYTAAPTGPDLMRLTTIEYGVTEPPHGSAATAEEFRASIRRVTGVELECRELRWVSWFGDATRLAGRYTDGRVFLAGDAAHVFFPTNGFGLSTGLGDAVNLGWKIAAELGGRASAGLLGTYHGERHPLGERLCAVTRAQGELLYPPGKVEPIREVFRQLLQFGDVQRYLIDLVAGLDVRYPLGDAPLLGARLPPVTLARTDGQGEKVTVAETLRTGRGVLLDLSAGAVDVTDASPWHDRVDVVTAEPATDVPAAAVLLRPDGHVAWTGDGEPLRTALGRWFGEPAEPA